MPGGIDETSILLDGEKPGRDQIDRIDSTTLAIATSKSIGALQQISIKIGESAGIRNPSASTAEISIWTEQEPSPIVLETVLHEPFDVLLTLTPREPDGRDGYYLHRPHAALVVKRSSGYEGEVIVHYRFDNDPGSLTLAQSETILLPDGVHTLYYWGASPRDGLIGDIQSSEVKVDSTAPQLHVSAERDAHALAAGTVDLVVTASEACVFSVTGKHVSTTVSALSSRLSVPLVAGTNTFVVVATDPAGNVGKAQVMVWGGSPGKKDSPVVLVLYLDRAYAMVNGRRVTIAAPARMDRYSGRIMVPIRFVAEQLGAKVSWDDRLRRVSIERRSFLLVLSPGSDLAFVNSRGVRMGVSASIVGGTLYVPLRTVAEALGATVTWDAKAQSATVIVQ